MALQAQPQAPSFLSGVLPNGQTPQTAPLPPQILAQRLLEAQQMRRAGADSSPIRSWTQGMARVADALVGGYEENQAASQYQQGLQGGAQAEAGFLNRIYGGSGTPGTGAAAPSPGQTSDSGAGSGATIGGNGAAKQAFDYFSQKYGPVAASGIVGNWMQESSFSPTVISGQKVGDPSIPAGPGYQGGSHYIGQWNRERLANLNNFASTKGLDPSDLNTQMQFADWELNNGYGSIKDKLLSAKTPGDAAAAFLGYEAPQGYKPGGDPAAVNGWGNRLSYANDAFQRFGGNAVAGNTAPSPAPNAGASQNSSAPDPDQTADQPPPTGHVQVASLDPSAGASQAAAQQPPAPDTNIPLPPVDPRAGMLFNKGIGAPSPGQQVVASAVAGDGNAPSAPPLTPGQQTVANAVGGAGGDATAPPLTAGGQKVAQAVMPQGPAQGGQGPLSPELMQQYTAVMQNPYVSENEKAMINQAFMTRIMPHELTPIATAGGTGLYDRFTGQQRGFVSAPNYQKVTDINGVEHVLDMNDPQQAAMASGIGAGGSSGAMGGGSQLQPGQKTVREMFPGVPRPGAEEAFYTNKYNQGITQGLSDQDARAAADEFDVNYRKQGAQTVTYTGESAEAAEAGKDAGARRSAMLSAADAAPGVMSRISLLKDVLAKTQTGPLSGMLGKAGALASSLGIGPDGLKEMGIDPNQAVDNQIAQKMSNKMVSESIGAGKGIPASNFSVAERQFIEKMYPNIENQAGSNEAVSDVLLAEQQHALDLADGWSQYKQQVSGSGKPPSYEAFEDQWRQQHGKDNIFQPVIDKFNAGGYSTIGTQAPGVAPQTNSQVDQPPPIAGAKKALDGNYYVPDPNRPGKYLKVVP
jgi:hypothetical protein